MIHQPVAHRILMLSAVLLMMPMPANVVGQDPDLVKSVLKSIGWEDAAFSHDLELIIRKHESFDASRVELAGFVREPFNSHFESILKIRCLSNSELKAFAIAASYGISDFKMEAKGGSGLFDLSRNDEESEDKIAIGKSGTIGLFDLEGRPRGIGKRSRKSDVFEMMREMTHGVKLSAFPFVIVHESPSREILLEKVVEHVLLDRNGKPDSVATQTSKDGKNQVVVRVKMPNSAACRIVISSEGFDKGFVTEFHEAFIKTEENKNLYINEDQTIADQQVSNYITWKEYNVPKGKDSSITTVLPLAVRKTATYLHGGKRTKLETANFNWKSFEPQNLEQMTLEQTMKTCKQYRKEIDRLLNR